MKKTSIFRIENGAHIDLDKIVCIDPIVRDREGYILSIHFQLMDKPTNFFFELVNSIDNGDVIIDLGEIWSKSNKQRQKFNIFDERERILNAWIEWKTNQ